jgi:hypothetical protein
MKNIVGLSVYIGILVVENLPIGGAGLVAGMVVYRVAKKRLSRPFTFLLAAVIPAFAGLFIYRGFYPEDKFYLSEYKAITRDTSIAAIKVVYGSATYPTFHPDYCSTAILEMEKLKFYSEVMEIEKDSAFDDTMLIGSEAYSDVVKHMDKKPVFLKRFSRRDESNHYFIGFMPGNKALINRCYD